MKATSKKPRNPAQEPEKEASQSTSWTLTKFWGQTIWDWMDLLIVPFLIALSVALLSGLLALAQQRTAEQSAHQAALQTYLDQMGQLMLDEDRPLGESQQGDEVQTLARARTLTMLGRLGPDLGLGWHIGLGPDFWAGQDNKRTIVEFLREASLIDKDNPIIRLDTAHLEGADLNYAALENARLPFVYLEGANLDHAVLEDAELGGANLNDAYLGSADLSNASLRDADLSDADLREAELDSTFLKDADLSGANLAGANLSGANLWNAEGVNEEALAQQTDNLGLATMPDGTIHTGHYVTDEFVKTDGSGATLSFDVGKGWKREAYVPASTGELYLEGPGDGLLIFTSPSHVFEPKNPSGLKEIPAPENAEDWSLWFQQHPHLDHPLKESVVQSSVGSQSGKRIDVTYCSNETQCSKPIKQPSDLCGERSCVPLFPTSDPPGQIASFAGDKDRLIMVDVNGASLVINVSAPAEEFDAFLPKAQKVLKTVEWKIGSS